VHGEVLDEVGDPAPCELLIGDANPEREEDATLVVVARQLSPGQRT
jgi:hypothetical protein